MCAAPTRANVVSFKLGGDYAEPEEGIKEHDADLRQASGVWRHGSGTRGPAERRSGGRCGERKRVGTVLE